MREAILSAGQIPSEELYPPNVLPEAEFYYRAWCELSGDRQMGMGGVGPIPFMSLDRYADRYGVHNVDEFSLFSRIMRAMDSVYIKHVKDDVDKRVKNG